MKAFVPFSLLRPCLVTLLMLALILAPFPPASRNRALALEPVSTTVVVGGVTLTVAEIMIISSALATITALICQGVSKDEAIARGMEALARENQALLQPYKEKFQAYFSSNEYLPNAQATCEALTDLRFQSASLGFAHEGLIPILPSREIRAALEFQHSNANAVLQERIFEDTEALWLSEASVSTRAFLMSREGSEIASARSQKMSNLRKCLRDPAFWGRFVALMGLPAWWTFVVFAKTIINRFDQEIGDLLDASSLTPYISGTDL